MSTKCCLLGTFTSLSQSAAIFLFLVELYGNHLSDVDECPLQDGVDAVAQTNLLCNLGGVDGIVLSEILLHLVRYELSLLLALKDGVQQKQTVLLQTTCHIVHVEIRLNVASHEVRCGYEVCATERCITETQVRAGKTSDFLES